MFRSWDAPRLGGPCSASSHETELYRRRRSTYSTQDTSRLIPGPNEIAALVREFMKTQK